MPTSHRLAIQSLRHMASNRLFPELNGPQRAAAEAALSRRLTLIQGPPGTGKTTVAASIAFGFVHQCRSLSPHQKVLACAFSNVGADNLAEAMVNVGLNVVRVGKASAVTPALWEHTLDAAISRDPDAQKALSQAAKATAQLSKLGKDKRNVLSDRMVRDAATRAVKASIEASNVAATRALREADVIVSTSTGAADPRLLAACGLTEVDLKPNDEKKANERDNAPDGGPPLSLPFVLIDEACQSVEPATLIPILASNSCRSLVLLGDPCQLPPTLRQPSELSVSLMERLAAKLPHPSVPVPHEATRMDTSYLTSLPVKQAKSLLWSMEGQHSPSYRKRFGGSLLLSIQYRMHPSIASLPSALFYDGLLATPVFMKDVRRFPRILNSLYPCGDPSQCVRVIDVGGRCNERKGSGTHFGKSLLDEQTSYSNEPEAERVVSLVWNVLNAADPSVTSIGIISPYNGQVQLIKRLLASHKQIQERLEDLPVTIEVKSVDGYQGRERDLIVFSAVRSNRRGNIGFLRDWRRLNVALTRAKSGLVVIGDMETLSESDKHWAAFNKWATGQRVVVDDSDSPGEEMSL